MFTSPESISIPQLGNATPYPATIQVSGLTTPITDVDVTLTGLTQDCLNDLAVLLVAPTGQKSLVMADVPDSQCQQTGSEGRRGRRRPERQPDLRRLRRRTGAGPGRLGYLPAHGRQPGFAHRVPSARAGRWQPAGHPVGLQRHQRQRDMVAVRPRRGWDRRQRGRGRRDGGWGRRPISGGWTLSITTASAVLDTTAPDTTITRRPTYRHPRHSRFKAVSSEAGSTFRCRVDGGPVQPCGPKIDYVGLKKGKHTLVVYAVDAAGNADATPASATWKVWRRGTGHLPQ